jgi:hypothetical protein
MALNRGKFCLVILFQKAKIAVFVIIFQTNPAIATGMNRRIGSQNQ